MATIRWTRRQLLIAFYLYSRIPFGQFHSKNKEIIKVAELIDRTPDALAMKLSNIASLDDSFLKSGRKGLSGASKADRAMWAEMQNDWEVFSEVSSAAYAALTDERFDEIPDLKGEDVATWTKRRRGQSFFRQAVLSAYEYRCCISGLDKPALIVASHIVPWARDEHLRVNPHNGLALSALYDRAFDQGLIALDDDCRVLLSQDLEISDNEEVERAFHAVAGKAIILPGKFRPDVSCLQRHREEVFLG